MNKYDPCAHCHNPTVRQISVDGMSENCLGKCLYADLEEKDMKREFKISWLIDTVERFETAYRVCGDNKTAAIIKGILIAMKTVFGRK